MKTKRENKLNSYVKMILIMCGGGVIGAFLGVGIFMLQDGIDEPFPPVVEWLGNQVAVILWIFVVISLILSLICYRNAEHYIRQMDVEDDSLMEMLDCGYERWSSFGVAGSNVIVCLAMVFFAFGFPVEDEETAKRLLGAIVPFLLTVIVCTMYQVAAVRQMRRKDPSKKGDAADLHFEKEQNICPDEDNPDGIAGNCNARPTLLWNRDDGSCVAGICQYHYADHIFYLLGKASENEI